ncbi:MAG: CBS domain-containing protein, partial [Candidatus Methanomethylophilaceae archaeon]
RQGKTMEEMGEMNIARVMEDSFPVVNDNTPMENVTSLMSNCNAVLVARKGKIMGVITNADMLKLI